MDEEIIDLDYLTDNADRIWESECESGGDADSATERLVDYIAEDFCSYIPIEYRRSDDWAKPFELLAKRIVAEHIKNFEDYEANSHEKTALEEAQADIERETMQNL